jgi:ribosomal subunit interface protein
VDLLVRGRGSRISDQVRRTTEHKLSKIGRFDPRVLRLEVEIIEERNPRVGVSHRVEVTAGTARRTFRAEGAGRDLESALDQVAERLERQISRYRGKIRNRLTGRGNRLKSPRPSADEVISPE